MDRRVKLSWQQISFFSHSVLTPFFFCGGTRTMEGLCFQFIFVIHVVPYPNWKGSAWKESCSLSDKLLFISCSLSSPSISRLANLWEGLPCHHYSHTSLFGSMPASSLADVKNMCVMLYIVLSPYSTDINMSDCFCQCNIFLYCWWLEKK